MFDYFAKCSCFPLLPEDISKLALLEPARLSHILTPL